MKVPVNIPLSQGVYEFNSQTAHMTPAGKMGMMNPVMMRWEFSTQAELKNPLILTEN